MTEARSDDPGAYEGVLRTLPRQAEAYGRRMAGLTSAINREVALANSALPPAEKVRHLRCAQESLVVLEDCLVSGSGFHIDGLAGFRARLAGLEATFRAFGYIKDPPP